MDRIIAGFDFGIGLFLSLVAFSAVVTVVFWVVKKIGERE